MHCLFTVITMQKNLCIHVYELTVYGWQCCSAFHFFYIKSEGSSTIYRSINYYSRVYEFNHMINHDDVMHAVNILVGKCFCCYVIFAIWYDRYCIIPCMHGTILMCYDIYAFCQYFLQLILIQIFKKLVTWQTCGLCPMCDGVVNSYTS